MSLRIVASIVLIHLITRECFARPYSALRLVSAQRDICAFSSGWYSVYVTASVKSRQQTHRVERLAMFPASRTMLHLLPPPFLIPCISLPRATTRTIRSLAKKFKPDRFNKGPGLPVLGASRTAALARKEYTTPWRTGALATKKGMTAIYDPDTAVRTPCTVLQLDRVQVVSHKTRPLNGYWAVQVGSGTRAPRNVSRPERGHYAANQIPLKRELREFRVKDQTGLLEIGTSITADWFRQGQFVDARANCRGMGFAGGMKRWGFSGQPASHGNSLSHRAMGSAGASQGSGSRVLPGKKMAGRMGGQRVTVQNLRVMSVDAANGLVVLKGCLAGPKGCTVQIQDAIKKPWPTITPTPEEALA